MARYATINPATQAVSQITDLDPAKAFHPSLRDRWTKVPDNVEVGMIRNSEGKFDPAPEIEAPETIPVENPTKTFTTLEFYELFKPEEEAQIRLIAKGNDLAAAQMEMFLERLKAAHAIHLDDPRVLAGLAALKTAGIISETRRKKIAAGEAPS